MRKDSETLAVEKIKEMIFNSEFSENQRITETSLSKMIGLSRTPIRVALKTLEASGLLKKLDGRGYNAKQITKSDQKNAISILGLLEAQAAQNLSMNGMSRVVRERLETSLQTTEKIINHNTLDKSALDAFDFANIIFHKSIIQASDNQLIEEFVSRLSSLYIKSIEAYSDKKVSINNLIISHSQHALIKEAIEKGDSGRTFSLMKEHTTYEGDYYNLFSK
tara:strand:- start:1088 stop:1750 length:663 start_codon:yes stop_codon:yes gene_type:complete